MQRSEISNQPARAMAMGMDAEDMDDDLPRGVGSECNDEMGYQQEVDLLDFEAELEGEVPRHLDDNGNSSDEDDDDLAQMQKHQYSEFGGSDSINSEVSILKDLQETDDSTTDEEPDEEEMDQVEVNPEPSVMPNTTMLKDFRAYCASHKGTFLNLTEEEKTGIRLLKILKDKQTAMNAYSSVMEWHLKEQGTLHENETLGDSHGYEHRKALLAELSTRYNLDALNPVNKRVRLPSSKAVVTVPCRDAKDCIISLLTDPRIEDQDYLFFNGDPLAPPPERIPILRDLNTGEAYLRSYEKMITKPGQVLLPVPMYIDGAVTGTFSDLPITALKISLGIHSREARDKGKCWRELGFVPQVRKDTSRGKKIFQESRHLESQNVVVLDGEGASSSEEGTDSQAENSEPDDEEDDPVKAQDFHTMLSVILESFVDLQRTGFIWDLVYEGVLYKNVEFVIFVPFVKCDTEEADLLCGKYLCRNKHVKHICRYCHCPTSNADDPRAKYRMKTQAEIQNLVEKNKKVQLQRISQQYIRNAWYVVQFHLANERGIHGACPSEKLHAIQLGLFKYIRSIFFKFCGETSKLADTINGLAKLYGSLFSRQSDRDLPNTNFAKGIRKGKLMATEYRGVLLVMAAVLRSSEGRKQLATRKRFGRDNGLDDWTLLVELMLEWETYLSENSMQKKHVKRLGRKHVYLMYIIRNVAKRTTGMGLRLMKFHAVLHLLQDMLLYGTPSEFDTGSNESMHKPSKYAAKLTQRNESSFNYQTANRLNEFLTIDYAKEEEEHGTKVWEYFDFVEQVRDVAVEMNSSASSSEADSDASDLDPDCDAMDADLPELSQNEGVSDSDQDATPIKTYTGGTRINVFEDEDNGGAPSYQLLGRSKSANSKRKWGLEVVVFLNELQNLIVANSPNLYLSILTEHKRGDITFRGHPNYRDKGAWKDWAIMDWGEEGKLPCHIWCFVTLKGMPIRKQKLQYGGITLTDGVFAVVEASTYDEDIVKTGRSDLFVPLLVDVQGIDADGDVTGRNFYLADVESIVGPCVVVPDVGGPTNAYFQVKPRRDWAKEFVTWLEQPHADDEMVWSDEEEDPND